MCTEPVNQAYSNLSNFLMVIVTLFKFIQLNANRLGYGLFYLDEGKQYIYHQGGLKWHPVEGPNYTPNGCEMVLHSVDAPWARYVHAYLRFLKTTVCWEEKMFLKELI